VGLSSGPPELFLAVDKMHVDLPFLSQLPDLY
jgi:hypothetical protein